MHDFGLTLWGKIVLRMIGMEISSGLQRLEHSNQTGPLVYFEPD